MKLFLRVAFALLLCLETLSGYAQGKDTESDIPETAFDGKLERRSFGGIEGEQVDYDVFTEEDFKKIDYSEHVKINLQEDITLSAPLTIKSKKTVLIEGHGHSISDGWRKPPMSCSEVYQVKSWTYDEETGLCTMTLPEELKGVKIAEKDSVLIAYELWFVRQIDKVVSAQKGKLTFYCRQHYKPTQKTRKIWTKRPMIYLMYFDPSTSSGQVPAQQQNGGADATIRYNSASLVRIAKGTRVKMHDIKIKNCPGGAVLSEGELYVSACEFCDVDGNCISVGARSYADITDSHFSRCGLKGSNNACIKGGGDAYIANNTFEDYNYAAISVGIVNTEKEDALPSVTIENNILTWSPEWIEQIKIYGLRDSGAIYVATNNRRTIIRNNSIENYGGHGHNRAIFCDDGAYNLTIYGNRIQGTQNSYDIDSRDCSLKPIRKVPAGYALNTNNYIGHNDCSGTIRLQASSVVADHGCTFLQ